MKILQVAPYMYRPEYPEFSRNHTGFGLMVNDIFNSIGKTEEVFLYPICVWTKGRSCGILRHKPSDVLLNTSLRDCAEALKRFRTSEGSLNNRIKNCFYALDRGNFKKNLKRVKPDLVHVHGVGVSTQGVIDACRETGISYVVTLHGLIGLDPSTHASARDRELERSFLVRSVEENIPVTVISTGIKRRIESCYIGSEAPNIDVVTNGAGTKTEIDAASDDYCNLRERFGLADDVKICSVVGNICERKNQIDVVHALARMDESSRRRIAVFFFGEDTLGGVLQHEIEKNRLEKSAYVMGAVPRECIRTVFLQVDLNIVASKDEGFGLSIVEAFSYGVPTVLYSDLDAVDDLYDPRCALLVQRSEEGALSRGMQEALSRRWDAGVIREHAQKFTLETMAENYIGVYKRVISLSANDRASRAKRGASSQEERDE